MVPDTGLPAAAAQRPMQAPLSPLYLPLPASMSLSISPSPALCLSLSLILVDCVSPACTVIGACFFKLILKGDQDQEEPCLKEIFLFSIRFLHLMEKLFWNIPSTSAKQAEKVRVKFEIPDNVWDAKWKQISSEYNEVSPRDQLQSGFKLQSVAVSNANDHSSNAGHVAAEVPTTEDGVAARHVIDED